MKRIFIIILLFIPFSIFAMDGNELLQDCSDGIKFADNDYKGTLTENINGLECIGYIEAVNDYNDIYVKGKIAAISYCPLSNFRLKPIQIMRIVVKYLNNNPQKLNLLANMLIVNAMHIDYPCHFT